MTREAPRSGPRKWHMIPLPDYAPKTQGEIFFVHENKQILALALCAYEQVHVLNLPTSLHAASSYTSPSNPHHLPSHTSHNTSPRGSGIPQGQAAG